MTVFTISASEIALATLLLIAAIAALGVTLRTYRVRRACRHTSGVRETPACDAICRSCGKNLGFIGKYRS